ncbi:hypothetical protein FOA52_011316 [Chlamydomonas sp. UWO 241]|nr:hypothetical protein FOA52_011316 [Chlamydomonas sp. UWO 241]
MLQRVGLPLLVAATLLSSAILPDYAFAGRSGGRAGGGGGFSSRRAAPSRQAAPSSSSRMSTTNVVVAPSVGMGYGGFSPFGFSPFGGYGMGYGMGVPIFGGLFQIFFLAMIVSVVFSVIRSFASTLSPPGGKDDKNKKDDDWGNLQSSSQASSTLRSSQACRMHVQAYAIAQSDLSSDGPLGAARFALDGLLLGGCPDHQWTQIICAHILHMSVDARRKEGNWCRVEWGDE